jgi:hypothetical protein
MKPITEINVFGVGRVARRAVAQAARRHPDVRFQLFSRNPRRHRPLPFANVRLCGLDGLAQDGGPLVLCMASDEGRILRALRDRPTGMTPRYAVAANNLRLLREVIDPRLWRHRLVVVVTNPVELVCEFVSRCTGNRQVYGFGMASDRERVLEAMQHGLGLPREEVSGVEVTGFHFLRPIPLLSSVPDLVGKLECMTAAEVAKNLAHFPPAYGATRAAVEGHFWRTLEVFPCKPQAHQLVGAVVNAITASEFRGFVPPRRRGAANLARLLSRIIQRQRVPVSGPVPTGYLLGGTLDLADGEFFAPEVGPSERKLLAEDMAEYDQLRRKHLGCP